MKSNPVYSTRIFFAVLIMSFALLIVFAQQDSSVHAQNFAKMIITKAEKGDANAQTMAGVMYEYGIVIPQNAEISAYWIGKAAGQGDQDGQILMGRLLDLGFGVSQDHDKALAWYRSAVLEELKRFASDPKVWFAGGYSGVFEAANNGEPTAQTLLGTMYATGKGVEQNDNEAVRWLTKNFESGELGGSGSQQILALFYEQGRGGLPKDQETALRLYRKVADTTNEIIVSSVQHVLTVTN